MNKEWTKEGARLARVNELAKELNVSTSEWLNAWMNATDRLATEQDIAKLVVLAQDKRRMAEELNELLADELLVRMQMDKH